MAYQAQGRASARPDRLAYGHVGDATPVGEGVSELCNHHGPGYRIYFHYRGNTLVILLCGGHKGTQERDIKTAKRLLDEWSGLDD